MSIKIFLRKSAEVNNFRDLILSAVSSGIGDEALICSGFFQDEHAKSAYRVSCEGCFAFNAARTNIKLKTIGVHNNQWLNTYRKFIRNMKAHKVNIVPLISRGLKWHAKVFIYLINDKPVITVIGSSNMTRNAFSTTKPFNYECDVVMWDSDNNKISDLINSDTPERNHNDVITLDYLEDKNGNISINDRMEQIYKELIAMPLHDFE